MKSIDEKLKRLREMKTDSPQMIEALEALSLFYGNNQSENKNNSQDNNSSLRSQMEARNVSIAKDFLKKFEPSYLVINLTCSNVRYD